MVIINETTHRHRTTQTATIIDCTSRLHAIVIIESRSKKILLSRNYSRVIYLPQARRIAGVTTVLFFCRLAQLTAVDTRRLEEDASSSRRNRRICTHTSANPYWSSKMTSMPSQLLFTRICATSFVLAVPLTLAIRAPLSSEIKNNNTGDPGVT